MPNIITRARETVGKALLAPQLAVLQKQFAQMQEAYFQGPYELPPRELAQRLITGLQEYDSGLIYDLLEQMQYDLIGAVGFGGDVSGERTRAVQESRRLWKYDPLATWMINLWTNYGFGENIEIVPSSKEPMTDELNPEGERIPLSVMVFNEFWTAARNTPVLGQDRIQRESNRTLIDGQRFWVYSSAQIDGETTIRRISPDQIVEIMTDPNDDLVPWFYKRTWVPKTGGERVSIHASITRYYPDWQLFFTEEDTDITVDAAAELLNIDPAERADLLGRRGQVLEQDEQGTWFVVQHVAHNQKEEDELWGWPLLAPAGAPWLRAHREFRQDRAAVASAVAMFVNKVKHKGGSRAGAGIRSQMQSTLTQASTYLDTNPPPVAGSTFIENEAAKLDRMPLGTGAGDAKSDGESLAWMGLLAGSVFPHFAGIDAHLYTREEMSGPLLRNWSRYQLFWSAQFRAMVEIVLRFKEKGSGGSDDNASVKFETYDAEVSTDQLVETDLPQVTEASQKLMTMLTDLEERGLATRKAVSLIAAAVTRVQLQGFGIADGNKIASDEALVPEAVENEEEPEEEPEEPTEETQVAALVKENVETGDAALKDAFQWAVGQVMEEGNDEPLDADQVSVS